MKVYELIDISVCAFVAEHLEPIKIRCFLDIISVFTPFVIDEFQNDKSKEVVDAVVSYYYQNQETIELAQVEGFVMRQIVSWHE